MTYLDAASATPLHPAAREVWAAALEDGWADPARLYREGRRAARLLDAARASVAGHLGVGPQAVSFTANGTSAAHLAVLGGLGARARHGSVLVHSAVEHSCVLQAATRHRAAGGATRAVPVDRLGRVDAAEMAAAVVAPGTALVALISASHEVGTLQPVAEVAAACRAAGVPLVVDAAQTLGTLPVPAGWDLLAASARKWGGPPGVGILAVRPGTRWRSPLPADEHEHGRAPGSVPLPAVLAAAAALDAREAERERRTPGCGRSST